MHKSMEIRSRGKLAAALLVCGTLVCLQLSRYRHLDTWTSTQDSALLSILRRHLEQSGPNFVNITAPVAVHGWVKKAGPLDPIHWHDEGHTERRAAFNTWLTAWTASQDRVGEPDWLPEPPKVIFPACQIFVNHRYKFIYIRLRKTGSYSLVHHLSRCDSAQPGPACVDILPSNTSKAEVARLFSEYFVFTVVRNPFKRALSSYKFLFARMHAEPPSCTQGLGWDTFCTDPMALGLRCRLQPGCCYGSAGMFWAHIVEQTRCMRAAVGPDGSGGGWAVDYIGRTERMGEDVAEILQEIDRRREPGAPALSGADSSSDSSSSDGDEDEEGPGSSRNSNSSRSGPEHLNSAPSCDPSGGRLQPRMRMSGDGLYLAAVPEEQYCDDDAYFSGRHEGCVRTLRYFFQRDLRLLYEELPPPSRRRRQTERLEGLVVAQGPSGAGVAKKEGPGVA